MNNINKTIKGVSLLTDINLALESGHIYGFVGDNGSGKTVLFKVLLGLMHKTSGTILVDGREQKDLMQDVGDRKSTRLNSSHVKRSRMPSSA